MKKIKTIIILFVFAIAGFIFGCATTTTQASNNTFEIKYENSNADKTIYTTVDTETGVNYIIACSGKGISIIPRYNADGSLYVSE